MGMADRVISPKIPVSPKTLKKSLSVASPSEPGPVPIDTFFLKAVRALGHSTLNLISPDLETPASISTCGYSSRLFLKMVGVAVEVGMGASVLPV